MTGSFSYSGHIYPPLVGNAVLTKPSPKSKFFLKAKVKFCKKSAVNRKREVNEGLAPTFTACCPSNMYFDQLISLKSGGDNPCRPCPGSSAPRLHGYYCESCSSGSEPLSGSFGCASCKEGFVKARAGKSHVKCPPGMTTHGGGQTKCYRKKGSS